MAVLSDLADKPHSAAAARTVFIDGEAVIDLWAGSFDMSYTRPWERDTIVHTFSSTKTMTALCALILADRGEIDLAAPVAKYWPEFAANGKDAMRRLRRSAEWPHSGR